MAEAAKLYDITFVPMDLPVRDDIMAELGVFDVDWGERQGHITQPEIEACVGYKGNRVEKDLRWVYNLPMVRKFYARPGTC